MAAAANSTELWAASLFAAVNFPDARLATRAVKFVAALTAHPGDSIAGACEDRQQAKAAYRFIENERVTVADILPSLAAATEAAYDAASRIRFQGMHYRRDIAQKGLRRLRPLE